MKKILLTLLSTAFFFYCFSFTAAAEHKRYEAQVIKVTDGDTIQVLINNTKEKVRLIGVDTPETKHPKKGVQYYGKEASQFTKSQLEGRTVYLEFDVGQRDRYKRILAYVWLDPNETNPRAMFNSILLLEGYAQLMTIQPNVKYADLFKEYQREARENNRGLWK